MRYRYLYARGRAIEGDQREPLPQDRHFGEWHGDRRTCASSPQGVRARPQEHHCFLRLPGSGNPRARDAERESVVAGKRVSGRVELGGGGVFKEQIKEKQQTSDQKT